MGRPHAERAAAFDRCSARQTRIAGHLGRTEEVRDALERLLALNPGLTVAAWRASYASRAHAPELLPVHDRLSQGRVARRLMTNDRLAATLISDVRGSAQTLPGLMPKTIIRRPFIGSPHQPGQRWRSRSSHYRLHPLHKAGVAQDTARF
jgi:hypothetical protein